MGTPIGAAAALAKFSAVKDVDSQDWGLPKVNPAARPPAMLPPNIVAIPTAAMDLLFWRSLLMFASALYLQVVTTAAVTCGDSEGAHHRCCEAGELHKGLRISARTLQTPESSLGPTNPTEAGRFVSLEELS